MNIDTIKEMIKEKLLEALKSEEKMPMGPGEDGKKGTEDDRPAFLPQKTPEKKGNIENMPEPLRKAAEKKQKQNEEQEIFAPNHYCVHHGGVQHNGSVQMAEAVSHNYNKELGRVTHYDMKLEDGTILEGVAAEDIQVTNASLAEAHHPHAVRDDEEDLEERVSKHDKQEYQGMPRSPYEAEYMRRKEEEEKEQQGKPVEEGKIQTPEQEKLLYESRFTARDTDLFDRLMDKWIKYKK